MQASLNNTIAYAQSVRKIGFILRKKFYSEVTQCILNQLCTWLVQRSTSVPCVCSVLQQTTVAEALEACDTQARQLAECQTRSFNAHLRARTLERLLCKRSVIVATSLLRISVIGSIARGDQRLNCSMRGSMEPITGTGKRPLPAHAGGHRRTRGGNEKPCLFPRSRLGFNLNADSTWPVWMDAQRASALGMHVAHLSARVIS